MKNSFFMVALFSFSIVAHAGSEIQLRELSVNDVEAKRLGTTEILVKSSRLPIDRKQNVHKILGGRPYGFHIGSPQRSRVIQYQNHLEALNLAGNNR